jgi:hypothetical protein
VPSLQAQKKKKKSIIKLKYARFIPFQPTLVLTECTSFMVHHRSTTSVTDNDNKRYVDKDTYREMHKEGGGEGG